MNNSIIYRVVIPSILAKIKKKLYNIYIINIYIGYIVNKPTIRFNVSFHVICLHFGA